MMLFKEFKKNAKFYMLSVLIQVICCIVVIYSYVLNSIVALLSLYGWFNLLLVCLGSMYAFMIMSYLKFISIEHDANERQYVEVKQGTKAMSRISSQNRLGKIVVSPEEVAIAGDCSSSSSDDNGVNFPLLSKSRSIRSINKAGSNRVINI